MLWMQQCCSKVETQNRCVVYYKAVHLEGFPTRIGRRRRREVFLIKLLQLNLFHARFKGCNMICLLVSYPWQIICHLATELKRELKELWTNSRLVLLEWFFFRQIHL